jgi:hypothetical protein
LLFASETFSSGLNFLKEFVKPLVYFRFPWHIPLTPGQARGIGWIRANRLCNVHDRQAGNGAFAQFGIYFDHGVDIRLLQMWREAVREYRDVCDCCLSSMVTRMR